MSSGFTRQVSDHDIRLVKNLIEHCLSRYMSKKDVVETLRDQAKIETGFTELVWQKLEEQNQDFFMVYGTRVIVKDQIEQFNKLMKQQELQLLELQQTAVASQPYSNGTYISANEDFIPSHSYSPIGNVHAVDVGQSETLHPLLLGSEDAGSTQYHHPTHFSTLPIVPPHYYNQIDNQSYAVNLPIVPPHYYNQIDNQSYAVNLPIVPPHYYNQFDNQSYLPIVPPHYYNQFDNQSNAVNPFYERQPPVHRTHSDMFNSK